MLLFGSVPSFYYYVNTKCIENPNNRMTITMTHNLFEARLYHSKTILSINTGVKNERKLSIIRKR